MSRYKTIVISCLVFLISLFFFKAVVPSLGLTLFFLLLTILFEIVWVYWQTPFFTTLRNLFLAVILGLSIYSLFFLPVEFLVTEVWFFIPKVPILFNSLLLLGLVVILCLVDWNKLLKKNLLRFSLLILVIFSSLVYLFYRNYKLAREYLPKIYQVDPRLGIQAQIIEIKGVNFSPAWKRGKVFLDDLEMTIKSWTEESISAEQPVPAKFGEVNLYVARDDGVKSNPIRYRIRNPDELRIRK